jgi:hypothetical protein
VISYSLSVKITDSIREPDLDMPTATEINNRVDAILLKTEFSESELADIRALPNGILRLCIVEIKWNLYRKHRKALDILMEELDDVIQEDKGEYFAELFNSKVPSATTASACYLIWSYFTIGWTRTQVKMSHHSWPTTEYTYC